MELSEEKILLLIFKTIDEINKMLPEERRLKKLPDTFLTGDNANLDSLGQINFIVELESRLRKDFGLEFNFIELLERPDEPMKSVGRLAKFIKSQVNREEK